VALVCIGIYFLVSRNSLPLGDTSPRYHLSEAILQELVELYFLEQELLLELAKEKFILDFFEIFILLMV
jgi:hypothetical protein